MKYNIIANNVISKNSIINAMFWQKLIQPTTLLMYKQITDSNRKKKQI